MLAYSRVPAPNDRAFLGASMTTTTVLSWALRPGAGKEKPPGATPGGEGMRSKTGRSDSPQVQLGGHRIPGDRTVRGPVREGHVVGDQQPALERPAIEGLEGVRQGNGSGGCGFAGAAVHQPRQGGPHVRVFRGQGSGSAGGLLLGPAQMVAVQRVEVDPFDEGVPGADQVGEAVQPHPDGLFRVDEYGHQVTAYGARAASMVGRMNGCAVVPGCCTGSPRPNAFGMVCGRVPNSTSRG